MPILRFNKNAGMRTRLPDCLALPMSRTAPLTIMMAAPSHSKANSSSRLHQPTARTGTGPGSQKAARRSPANLDPPSIDEDTPADRLRAWPTSGPDVLSLPDHVGHREPSNRHPAAVQG